MTLWGTMSIAVSAIRVNALRSALTMLGIVIGVGAVITMVAIGSGAQQQVEEQIRNLGSNLFVIRPGNSFFGGRSSGADENVRLTEKDADAIRDEVPMLEAVAPTLDGRVQLIFGGVNWSTSVTGTTPGYFEARDWVIDRGRSFTHREVDSAAKIGVIGATVAEALFGGGEAIGQTIRVNKVPITIVGILAPRGQSMGGSDYDDTIVVPISTARQRLVGGSRARADSVRSIYVSVQDGADMLDIEDQIEALLRQRQNTAPNDDSNFRIRNLSEIVETREATGRTLTLLLSAIASVSLLVGGIGIMNIMLVSVTERTREIGLRQAVGARRGDILTQFLVEAVTLSLAGGVLGCLAGIGSAIAIAKLAGWAVLIEPASLAVALGFAAAVGVFFGYYPARKASLLNPIEALRYE